MTINAAGNMPKGVAEEWQSIWAELVDLHSFWAFHRDLCGNSQHQILMEDILPGPLLLIRRACLTSIVMGVGRLFDKSKPTLSLSRLLATIKQQCPNNLALQQNLKTMFNEAEICYWPMKAWRHQRFGHRNKAVALGMQPLPNVDEQSFDKVLSQLRKLLEAIHTHFNNPDTSMDFPIRRGDADDLMKYIRRGYEAEQAEIAALL